MLTQYVFVRNDLKQYNRGQLIVQGIHSSAAALFKFKYHPDTVDYTSDLENMTTVVLMVS